MKLAKILSGIAAILLAGGVVNAEIVSLSYNATHVVGSADINFALNKFDARLGTLTGVSVNVVYSTLQGSVSITNNDLGQVTVNSYDSLFRVKQSVENNLGFTAQLATKSNVKTTPTWVSATLTANQTKSFTINGSQNFTNFETNPQDIDSSFFAAYTSSDGSGTVVFQSSNTQSITTSGSSYTVNSAGAGANTKLEVVYTYDNSPVPVPEASTVIVQLLIVAGGVWMFVRRRRAAAVRA